MVHGPVVLSKANRVYNVGDIDLNLNNIVLLVFFGCHFLSSLLLRYLIQFMAG